MPSRCSEARGFKPEVRSLKSALLPALRHSACVILSSFVICHSTFAAEAPSVDASFATLKTYRAGQDNAALFVLESFANRVSSDPAQRAAVAERFAAVVSDPQTSDDAKLFAVKQLKLVASDAQVPLLAKLLDDPQTTDLARLALQTLPGQHATDALLVALAHLQGVPLAGVVNSLGARRETAAVPKLAPLLSNPDPVVITATLRALASIGTTDAAKSLATFKATPQTEVAWFDALLVAAANLSASKPAEAYALCDVVWNSTNPTAPKAAALTGLVRANAGQAMPALLASLRSQDATLRATAASLVAGVKDAGQLSRIAALVPQLSFDTQALLCDAFAANGERTLLTAVLPLISSSNEATRLAAISAVGRLGGVANVDALLQLAASDPANVRNAARKALSILNGADVDPRLVALTGEGPASLRVEAIRALAARNAKSVPALFNLASDADAAVQRAAVEALGSLVTSVDFPRFVSVLVAQAGKPASQAAVQAVVAAGKRVPDPAQRAKPAVDTFPAASPVAKAALLEVLGSFGGSEALAVVAGALKDSDASVREAALETLADWPDASAAKALLAAAQSAGTDAVRAKAWGAYVRLALESEDQAAPLMRQASAAAKTPADRQSLLTVLASADQPTALAAAAALLSDPATADEAAKVTLSLARKFAKTDNDAAVTAAERVTQVAKDPALVAQAREFLAKQGTAAQALDSAPYGKDVIATRRKEIAAQLPAGDTLLAYLDAGVETQTTGTGGPSLRQLNGRAWDFSESGKATLQQTVAFDGKRLTFEFAGLDAKKFYAAMFTWTDGDSGGRSASVDLLDGTTFQAKPALKQTKLPAGTGSAATVRLPLNPAAYASGKARIAFNNLSGPNVAVGELWLVETKAGGQASVEERRTPKVLIVTGIDYPAHEWRKTAPVLKQMLESGGGAGVLVVEDPAFLDSAAITNYDVVLLHFQNWEVPGPGAAARANLQRYVENGGGLVSVHFACGAWHGEWPEFAGLLGRVWRGSNGPQHDARGPFTVQIVDRDHAVTRGLSDFETDDELYTCLVGDAPIHLLAQAKSKVDQQQHPQAYVREFGKGRVFLTTLGHDARAFTNHPAVGKLIRQGTAWAAGRN